MSKFKQVYKSSDTEWAAIELRLELYAQAALSSGRRPEGCVGAI